MNLPETLPRPAMTPRVRRIAYAAWSWITVLVLVTMGGLAAAQYDVPRPLQAVAGGLLLFGVAGGFMAARHVDDTRQEG